MFKGKWREVIISIKLWTFWSIGNKSYFLEGNSRKGYEYLEFMATKARLWAFMETVIIVTKVYD